MFRPPRLKSEEWALGTVTGYHGAPVCSDRHDFRESRLGESGLWGLWLGYRGAPVCSDRTELRESRLEETGLCGP